MDFVVKDTLKMLAYGVAAYAIPLIVFWTFVG